MTTYYVSDSDGDDTDTGLTEALAWKTISKVNAASFSAGDSILFNKGDTWTETLTVPSSGASGSVITFGSYGTGAAPVINGSDVIETWAVEPIGGEDFTDGSGSQLIAYYNMEDAGGATRLDGTANNNDLSDTNGVARSGTSVQGSFSARIESATTEYLTRADGDLSTGFPWKNGEVTEDFTIGCWVQVMSTPDAGDTVWMKRNMAVQSGGGVDLTSTKFRFFYKDTSFEAISANDTFSLTTWYHVVVRRKVADSNQVSMFVDGVKQTSTNTLSTPIENTGDFRIGATTGDADHADLLVDEFFVTNEALSDSQILDIKTYGLDGTRDSVTTVFKADYTKATQQVDEDGSVLNKIAWDTDFATSAALMSAGSWTYDESGELMYVWASDGQDPDTHVITAKRDCVDFNGQDYIKANYLRVTGGLKGFNANWRDEGRLLEGFETVGDWTAAGTGGAVTEDTTNYIQGSKSVKLVGTSGTVSMTKEGLNLGVESDVTFTLGVYTTDYEAGRVLKIFLSSTSDFSVSMDSENLVLDSAELNDSIFGWTRLTLPKSAFSATGGATWADVVTHIKIESHDTANDATSITFDDFRAIPTENQAIIIGISFDDGFDGVIGLAKAILDGNGQLGVAYVIHDDVGTADHMTEANLDTLYAAGWDISNHTETGQPLAGLSQSAQETEINDMFTWLNVTKGFTRSAAFLAWSGGSYDAQAISVAKVNCKHARSIAYVKYGSHLDGLNDDFYWIKSITGDNAAVPIAGIDLVIAQKSVGELYFHQVSTTGAGGAQDLDDDDLQTISDYLKTKTDAGEILLLTASEFWDYSHLEGIEIVYNVITDCEVGISLGGTTVSPIVYNNTVYGCGVSISQKGQDSTVKNNIGSTSDIREAEFWWGGWTETNNIFHGTIDGFSRDGTTLSSDPLFTDAGNNDFTLQEGSPAIDAGVDVSLTQDYVGAQVPKGSAPDIGAYEASFGRGRFSNWFQLDDRL